jgi:hypothetical protein
VADSSIVLVPTYGLIIEEKPLKPILRGLKGVLNEKKDFSFYIMFVSKNHARTIGCNVKACVLSIKINCKVNTAMLIHRENYVIVG